MSMMVFFVLSFFPRGVLDEILNLIESVSEGFPSYSSDSDILGFWPFNSNLQHFCALAKLSGPEVIKNHTQLS